MVQGFKMPNLVDEYKTIFLGKRSKRWNCPKIFSYIRVFYKFVLKSFQSLNRILWASEYWFKTLKCQIWLTNTKPFFCESEANVESLQKRSPYIWVLHKFVLKTVKILTRISWATEYWLKALKCQLWLTNTKPFFCESEANVETVQKFSPYIWVFYKFVLKSIKILNKVL